ncbi:MAG: hypothetical protein IPK82_03420 [Polyangiaceae bacterium]|nr:hypothetical protein [Polyangiaceae bacterium]
MKAAKLTQYLVLTSMTLLAVVVIWIMQSKFDGADRRAALGIVQATAAKNGHTLIDALDNKHPGITPVWSVQTESACFQHQRVRATVNASATAKPIEYDFVVDINGPSIHPGNPEGEAMIQLMNELPAVK